MKGQTKNSSPAATVSEKKVMTKEVENQLVDYVVQFAIEKGLTITNVNEVVKKVSVYMEDNATLNKKDYQ